MSSTDRIERRITLRAPVSRVWRAISDAREFGAWFGFDFERDFVVGQAIRGTYRLTIDECAIRSAQERVGVVPSGLRLPPPNSVFGTVQSIEPERYFAYRWVPYGIDAEADLEQEPTTLVEFTLEPAAEGTLLTVVESGFDQVPEHRRLRAFRMNEGGWTAQIENVRRHVERE